MGESLVIALKTLFCALGFVMLATLIFTISIDGLPFRKDLLTPYNLYHFYCSFHVIFNWNNLIILKVVDLII